ncbi:MAG: hypothetical protein ACK5KO_12195 [Arachnia sp.]
MRASALGDEPTASPAPAAPHREARPALGDEPTVPPQVDDSLYATNPFARPGSVHSTQPIPTFTGPVLPSSDDESAAEQTTPGRRGGGVSIGPAPQARRSAASSASPGDSGIPVPAPAAAHESQPWVRHHRRTLLIFVVGALVAALATGVVSYTVNLNARRDATPPSSDSKGSPSGSTTPEVVATAEDLFTVEDAAQIVTDANWAVADTVTDVGAEKSRAACLSADVGDVNPTASLQRTLGTTQDDKLALLHQIDVYATEDAARQVQAQRVATLANCNQVPARIASAATVQGLADEVTQATVVYEDAPNAFHTIVLVRTGTALGIIDVTRNDGAVSLDSTVLAMRRSLESICGPAGGTCPAETSQASPVPPPVVDPAGWLIPADLPRVRAGNGMWTTSQPAELTSKGMGCENMTLATASGPDARQQRTYLLTQDDQTPESFGLDEMLFGFPDAGAADTFYAELVDHLASCSDRVRTAKVERLGKVDGTGAEGAATTAEMFRIFQATSADKTVPYQLVVAKTGDEVSYLLISVTDDYQFSEGQLKAIAARTGERASQAPPD